MKVLSYIISLIFLWSTGAMAFAPGFLQVAGGGGAASGPVYTNCSEIGTAIFYWNGDHSSGTTYGCKNSTTTINGTLNNATVVSAATDPGVSFPESNGNVLKRSADGQSLYFSVTSKDIFDSSEGRLEFDIYLSTTTNGNTLVFFGNGTQEFTIEVGGASGTITFFNSASSLTSSDTVTDATVTRVAFRWSNTQHKIGIKIGNGSWSDSGTTYNTWPSEPAYVNFRALTFYDVSYIDNIRIYNTSGY